MGKVDTIFIEWDDSTWQGFMRGWDSTPDRRKKDSKCPCCYLVISIEYMLDLSELLCNNIKMYFV